MNRPFAVDIDSPLGYYVVDGIIFSLDEMSHDRFLEILKDWEDDQVDALSLEELTVPDDKSIEVTYALGSAKGDKYCDERGGLYGIELVRFTCDYNSPEHAKLLASLDSLRDEDGCRYNITLIG